ncbi:hypothetical protein CES85_1537 [Ochrobactrum quorumnocens]|uniref:Uncharacterized protein n=1 Tax=Ochrobactrum quorumnocens TaxID=271865 RepID=A0A248UKG6_9HYPH|nr:hypothetical protein CES85_1537 [[Ochrobactrum] quorumnocens]
MAADWLRFLRSFFIDSQLPLVNPRDTIGAWLDRDRNSPALAEV